MIARLVGHVTDSDTHWFKLKDGRTVSFHTALPELFTFYADNETWPSNILQDLGLEYTLLRNATLEEINEFLLESDIELEEDK